MEHLLEEGIKAKDLNGDIAVFSRMRGNKILKRLTVKDSNTPHSCDYRYKLGRILDKLYKVGLTQLFIKIALAAVKIFAVKMNYLHLDSSSMSVEGEYLEKGVVEEEGILKITHGYSRDKRPDLKQFMIDLICMGDGDIPIYFRVRDENESDQKLFAQIIKKYQKGWQIEALFVADAVLYSEENIQGLGQISWLSTVPHILHQY